MNPHLTLALWIGGGALEAAVGGFMWRRKLFREYPLFFAYVLSQLLRFVVLLRIYLNHDRVAYMQAFTILEAIDAGMSFAVMYELFRTTFQKYEGIRELGWMLMKWAVVVLVLLAALTAAGAPGTEQSPYLAAFYVMERSVSLLRAGLLFLLFFFYSTLGLRWSKMSFGVAVGFAIVTVVELITFTLRSHFGPAVYPALSVISCAAYDCALLEWLYVVLQPSAERPRVLRPPKWDVDGWNRALLELLQR